LGLTSAITGPGHYRVILGNRTIDRLAVPIDPRRQRHLPQPNPLFRPPAMKVVDPP
jgi:hypothetical protein